MADTFVRETTRPHRWFTLSQTACQMNVCKFSSSRHINHSCWRIFLKRGRNMNYFYGFRIFFARRCFFLTHLTLRLKHTRGKQEFPTIFFFVLMACANNLEVFMTLLMSKRRAQFFSTCFKGNLQICLFDFVVWGTINFRSGGRHQAIRLHTTS